MFTINFKTIKQGDPWGPVLATLRQLEQSIRAGDAARAMTSRWYFGKELLKFRQAADLLTRVIAQSKRSADEIRQRVAFAETYPTRKRMDAAIRRYPTWPQMVAKGLVEKTPTPSKAPAIPLQAPPHAPKRPSGRRTPTRSTPTIPPATALTEGQNTATRPVKIRVTTTTKTLKAPCYPRDPTARVCADCGVSIAVRTRCPKCTLRRWRAAHPDARHAQDLRYRAKKPKHVRALVRARVQRWRKRNRIAAKKTRGA